MNETTDRDQIYERDDDPDYAWYDPAKYEAEDVDPARPDDPDDPEALTT